MTATTSLRERLDCLADDCRESAAMCNVDTAEGQHWSRLAVELESIASALSTPPAGEWMPIASAPKDGSYILACDDDSHAVVRWDSGFDGGWVYAWHEYDGPLVMHSATHWQPLPQPPEPATQEVG